MQRLKLGLRSVSPPTLSRVEPQVPHLQGGTTGEMVFAKSSRQRNLGLNLGLGSAAYRPAKWAEGSKRSAAAQALLRRGFTARGVPLRLQMTRGPREAEIPGRCAHRELPHCSSYWEFNARWVDAGGDLALGCSALRNTPGNFRCPRLCFHSLPPLTSRKKKS